MLVDKTTTSNPSHFFVDAKYLADVNSSCHSYVPTRLSLTAPDYNISSIQTEQSVTFTTIGEHRSVTGSKTVVTVSTMTQNKNQDLTTTTLATSSTSLPFWKSSKSLLPSTSMSSQSFPSSRLQRSTHSSLLTTTQPMHMNKTKYGVISGLSILIVLIPAILFLAYWRKRHINKHVIKPVEFELRQASSDTTVQNRQLPAIPETESDNENLHNDANSYHQPATPEENHYHHKG